MGRLFLRWRHLGGVEGGYRQSRVVVIAEFEGFFVAFIGSDDELVFYVFPLQFHDDVFLGV